MCPNKFAAKCASGLVKSDDERCIYIDPKNREFIPAQRDKPSSIGHYACVGLCIAQKLARHEPFVQPETVISRQRTGRIDHPLPKSGSGQRIGGGARAVSQ